MADGRPRRFGAWVAWVDLESAVRAEFPESDPAHVIDAVEIDEIEHRLRCNKPYDGGNLVDLLAMWLDPTVLPYRLQARDWDEFDREAGRFQHYPLEVLWPSVCRFLNPRAVEVQDASEPDPIELTERERVNMECQRWLEGLMRADPSGGSRGTKDRRYIEAREQWPVLPRTWFNDLWKAAIARTGAVGWKRSGPAKNTRAATTTKMVH